MFAAGEANPFPPGIVAVRRRMRAIPINQHPARTWLVGSFGGMRQWQRLRERRTGAVIGYAWVRRSALLWRRVAWMTWLLAGVAAFADVAFRGGADERVVRDFSGELGLLVLVALLLIAFRVKAVLDPADHEVGIRG